MNIYIKIKISESILFIFLKMNHGFIFLIIENILKNSKYLI